MMLPKKHGRTDTRALLHLAAATTRGPWMRGVLHFAVLILICGWLGCKSASPSQYLSPKVMGRVLDAQSHQPIKGVQVRRGTPDESRRSVEPKRGGQALDSAPAVATSADGSFVLGSLRDLVVLQKIGWYSVDLVFEHRAYERFTTNYTLANATNSAKGEPVVNAGEILLRPRAR